MKRMIFSWVCPLMILLAFTLPGCSAKSAATAEQFQKAAEEVGYTVEEQDGGSLESIHLASKEDSSMVFYVCDSDQEAKTALVNLKANLPSDVNADHVDSSYYSRYTAETEDTYYSIIRMGNTILASTVEPSEKDNLQSVINALGY